MKKGAYPGDELCLARRKNDPGPCQNLRNDCIRHCNSDLRKKPDERCARYPMANGRCRLHGGRAVRGVEHPRFRTGETSRYFPRGNLAALYNEAYDRGSYTELREEIALATGMINQVLSGREESAGQIFRRLQKEAQGIHRANAAGNQRQAAEHLNELMRLIACGATAEMQRAEVVSLMEQRRKLVDSEGRRLERERQMLTLQQVMMRDQIFMEVLKELLSDAQLARIRTRLAERLGVQ